MSWQDNILQDFTIQTGDNEIYTVFWNKASKTASWNNETFAYIGVRGQMARKAEALARQFPLEFYFQGADHLETSQRFENSLNDKNPCLVRHPLYGNIVCQLFSVTFDNPDLNVTRITGTAIETLTQAGLVIPNPFQVIQLKQGQIAITAPETLRGEVPTVQDGTVIKNNMEASKTDALKIVTLEDQAKEYTNAFNTAISAVNTITATPIIAMAQVCNLISLPGTFQTLVVDRVNFLESQFDRFIATVTGKILKPTNKKLFEIQSSTCISTMCIAAITPVTSNEYTTTKSVLSIIDRIQSRYNQLVSILDSLEVSSGGPDEYYTYSADINNLLADCVNITLANLMQIALNGKQERLRYLESDSNAILLSHRFYGGSLDDSNLDFFISTNNLTYRQMLQIRKGTKIVYYV